MVGVSLPLLVRIDDGRALRSHQDDWHSHHKRGEQCIARPDTREEFRKGQALVEGASLLHRRTAMSIIVASKCYCGGSAPFPGTELQAAVTGRTDASAVQAWEAVRAVTHRRHFHPATTINFALMLG